MLKISKFITLKILLWLKACKGFMSLIYRKDVYKGEIQLNKGGVSQKKQSYLQG
jgi:hypothetical protein